MKKLKILPTILMLVLCVGVLAIGVYAITPTKNTISGSITINASNPALTINLYKSEIGETGAIVGTESQIGSYPIRSGDNLNLSSLQFSTSTANQASEVNKIRVRIEIISTATEHLGMYFSTAATPTPSMITDSIYLGDKQIEVVFSDYGLVPKNGSASAYLTFNLLELPTSTTTISLADYNLSLNIEGVNEDLVDGEYITSDELAEDLGYVVLSGENNVLNAAHYTTANSPTKLKVAEGVKTITGFDGGVADGLTHLILPSTCGDFDFSFTGSLISVYLSDGITTIGDGGFTGCNGLININVPSTVVSIGEYGLRTGNGYNNGIVLPHGLQKIDRYTGLDVKNLTIPATVTDLTNKEDSDPSSLDECENLERITFKKGMDLTAEFILPQLTNRNKTFGGWFANKDFTGTPVTTISAEPLTFDITLYAKWTEK